MDNKNNYIQALKIKFQSNSLFIYMISGNTNTVHLEQLGHKPYIGWWSDKRVV